MGSYPQDFTVSTDQGGPGQGQPLGGFGGNPVSNRSEHRSAVQRVGKAAVLLIHGNGGAADIPPWDMLDLKRMLLGAGYVEELIWAPSYLGTGTLDLMTPHTNNVNDVRDYIDVVCEYLDVDVVDVVAHSLGCSLTYSVCRGLEKRTAPVNWDQPKKWGRVGTFVALAGAFHGLGAGSVGEWKSDGEFMKELLTETVGGAGENPFGAGKPQTPLPVPHNITYFCGVATGDFIDAQNPGTGKLAGAVSKGYSLGSGKDGHKKIKESPAVFHDFLPYLNSVPPAPAVTIGLDKDSGSYPSPLTLAVAVNPPDRTVDLAADLKTKQFLNGFITDTVIETVRHTLQNGQNVTLATEGMWQFVLAVAGAADDLHRTFWVGVPAVTTTIVTDNATPFDGSLLVAAISSDAAARLYHSFDGAMWNEGPTVTIDHDTMVFFIAINPSGVASEVVSRSFTKRIPWQDMQTATANDHFIAGRIDVGEYLAYAQQLGFFTPFTLYLVNGRWVLDPNRPAQAPVVVPMGHRAAQVTPFVRVKGGDPQPGQHRGPLTVTLQAADHATSPELIRYSRDGSVPDENCPAFTGPMRFELPAAGNQVIACCTRDGAGNTIYQTFHYAMAP